MASTRIAALCKKPRSTHYPSSPKKKPMREFPKGPPKSVRSVMDNRPASAPQPAPIMKFFKYDHLPEHLQKISKPIGELAQAMDASLPKCPEKSAGLRKLLEAKDCFVRASL